MCRLIESGTVALLSVALIEEFLGFEAAFFTCGWRKYYDNKSHADQNILPGIRTYNRQYTGTGSITASPFFESNDWPKCNFVLLKYTWCLSA